MQKINDSITFGLPAEEKSAILEIAEKLEIPVSLFCRKTLKNRVKLFKNHQKFKDDQLDFKGMEV